MRAAWILVGVLGCGGGGSDTPVDAASDAPADAPICTHLQNLRTLRGKAQTFGTVGVTRYEGTICVEGRSDLACAMTAQDGAFELCAPSMADFGLRFTKTGFENTVALHGPSSLVTTETFSIGDDAFVGPKIWQAVGGPYPTDASHGNIVVHIGTVATDGTYTPLTGASLSILPSAGLTVRYIGADGADQTLNATAAAGTAIIGNVPVGDYDIQINSGTNPSCSELTNGHKSPDNSQDARLTVLGGTTVSIAMKCAP